MHSRCPLPFTGYKVKASAMGKEYEKKLRAYLNKDESSPPAVSVLTSATECDKYCRFRTADGSCNNLENPDYGRSFTPLRRFVPAVYEDGISAARSTGVGGVPLPSPRRISTTVHIPDRGFRTRSTENTHMLMQFAQIMDHDFTLTPIKRGAEGAAIVCCAEDIPPEAQTQGFDLSNRVECAPITIPADDPFFTSRRCMNFVRSVQIENANGSIVPSEQMNAITTYIDASFIYGSTKAEQEELRTFQGGLLKTSQTEPELLPIETERECEAAEGVGCFIAGDERVNEQTGLASMHTIWLREHNRIARALSDLNPHWKDERIFQEARRIVGAEVQHITYSEFLPTVLSDDHLDKHNLRPVECGKYGSFYDPTVDPSINNAFATAAYRFGHSLIRSILRFRNQDFDILKSRRLRNLFGNNEIITNNNGEAVDTVMRGLLGDEVQMVDRHISGELTNHLFASEEMESGMDLMSLNIQRGRDHGLPGYNAFREWCGLLKANNFGGGNGGLVNHTPDVRRDLEKVYRSTDDIELFPGGISETPVEGGLLGPTFSCLVARQFELLKIGDRFFYENGDKDIKFSRCQLREIRKASLSGVICENTNTKSIQPEAFRQEGCRNARVDCSKIPKIDLYRWEDWAPCTHNCGEN